MKLMFLFVLLVGLSTAQDEQDLLQELFGKGVNAFNKGNYTEAVSYYTKCIEFDSLLVNVRFNRATTYMRLREPARAKADLDFILERKPEFVNARMQRAVVYAEIGLPQLAVADLTILIEQDSTFPKARLLRGKILLNSMHDTTAACADLRSALVLGDSSVSKIVDEVCTAGR